jgi:serine/threonine protein kinase
VLCRGGFAEVEEVRVPGYEEVIARKKFVISRSTRRATRKREQIRAEAGNLMKLDHEHIVKVLGCYEVSASI